VRFPCRKSPEPPLRRSPKSGVSPAGMLMMVAVSDGLDRKTKNNLVLTNWASFDPVFPAGELLGAVSIWPCTVGKWAVSISSNTWC
jgi:hypothetical protein